MARRIDRTEKVLQTIKSILWIEYHIIDKMRPLIPNYSEYTYCN